MSGFPNTDAGSAASSTIPAVGQYESSAPTTPIRNETSIGNIGATQIDPSEQQTDGIHGRIHQLMAETLLPIGTIEKTLDTELMPPDLVRGIYKDGVSTSARLVGDWTEEMSQQIGGISRLYSKRATERATQVDGHTVSEQLRTCGGKVSKALDLVNEVHTQTDMSVQEIEEEIEHKLTLLRVYDRSNPHGHEDLYNRLSAKKRGNTFTQAKMGCLFANLSLAKEEEKEQKILDAETRKLKQEMRNLEKRIKRKQNSLTTEGTQQEDATIG